MLHERKPFSINSKFVAIRPFVMNGVSYTYDELVDVSGIEPRRIRQMYEAFYINIADDDVVPVAKAAVESRPEKTKPAKPVAEGKPSIRYKGFGKYEVVAATGETVAGPMAKDEAERELAKLA
jgi:hypothetical protein